MAHAVSFVARSGTGKTTLLEMVIRELKSRGYRVGAIKHDAHRFEIDHPGKDSHRMTSAGADTMLISSEETLAVVKKHDTPPPIESLVESYFSDVDIVLTEGFKKNGLPKIELCRAGYTTALICREMGREEELVAVAADCEVNVGVPVLDLNNPVKVADFIEMEFIQDKTGSSKS